jgi:glycosyltransferase involved in cell wall biosynthesis
MQNAKHFQDWLERMKNQKKPTIADRASAARLAIHQRRELLLELKTRSSEYYDLCKSLAVTRKTKNERCLKLLDEELPVEAKAAVWRKFMRERIEMNDAPILLFTEGPLDFNRYRALIMASDVTVLTTRGEGWGRPVQEAMSLAVPSIVTNWSGPTAFSKSEFSFLIPINESTQLRTVPDDLWFAGHKWAEPSVADVRKLLDEAEKMPLRKLMKMGALAREYIVNNLDVHVIGDLVKNLTIQLAEQKLKYY